MGPNAPAPRRQQTILANQNKSVLGNMSSLNFGLRSDTFVGLRNANVLGGKIWLTMGMSYSGVQGVKMDDTFGLARQFAAVSVSLKGVDISLQGIQLGQGGVSIETRPLIILS